MAKTKSQSHQTRKLEFPFMGLEIEVPADTPPGKDPYALWDYICAHPEESERVVREYETAYRKWVRRQKADGQAKNQSRKTGARSRKVSARRA